MLDFTRERPYHLTNEDCIPAMHRMAAEGVKFDLSCYSPPFASLFTYSDADQDMGNSRDSDDEFLLHHGFFVSALFPLIKSGRNVCVHVQNPTRTKGTHGYMGLWDMRGLMIQQYIRAGFIFYGDITIDKCPQAQAIRTKSHALTFASFEKDQAMCRPALVDYVLLFKAPGANAVPINGIERGELSREDWIRWARGVWYGIKETNTLNAALARQGDDERHLCPLQLCLIERVVKLWSNPGETVFSPFLGIGSECYVSVALGRNFVGTELKPAYFDRAEKNAHAGVLLRDSGRQQDLWTAAKPLSFHVGD